MKRLEIFMHQGCFSGERGSRMISWLVQEMSDVAFERVDMFQAVERMKELGVKMSPTLVLNNRIVSVGIPTLQELKVLLAK